MKTINDLRIKIFADGADKAGVTDYRIALKNGDTSHIYWQRAERIAKNAHGS
jgi:hypothetical protein